MKRIVGWIRTRNYKTWAAWVAFCAALLTVAVGWGQWGEYEARTRGVTLAAVFLADEENPDGVAVFAEKRLRESRSKYWYLVQYSLDGQLYTARLLGLNPKYTDISDEPQLKPGGEISAVTDPDGTNRVYYAPFLEGWRERINFAGILLSCAFGVSIFFLLLSFYFKKR